MIDRATHEDIPQLVELDHHVTPAVMTRKVEQGEVIVARRDAIVLGWLRYGYFWDSIPFMNMLTVQEAYRGQGIGTQLVQFWEGHLRSQGYGEVLTSSLANERGQFLYRKLGYQDCGALLLPGEPLEILFRKLL
ncbi:MAG: GNAT family N-acetyltransferase [Chloroflexaceae bacterium]|jgi:ribosomal protein S18 acetylase RimI-like enzyme|nr:GNAT family N-acetyltransferase [Chloroflexaceae bacterium]